ncbi:hypothetical protein K7432_003420 [Basidiobolus ranarum]|uniref:Thioesterase domain-containing protein n=1 Tax=Basidiobolus ranarum TaxID=34480 RepID=A0ABR2W673_9FUNG
MFKSTPFRFHGKRFPLTQIFYRTLQVSASAVLSPQSNYLSNLQQERENLKYVQELRNDRNYSTLEPYDFLPDNIEANHLTGHTLNKPGELALTQLLFQHKSKQELVAIVHLGRKLTGHPGIIHGGLLCTLLDEALFRVVLNQWPNRGVFTGQLNVKYLKPVLPEQFIFVKSMVDRIQDRKGFCKGTISDSTGKVLTEAEGVFIVSKEEP